MATSGFHISLTEPLQGFVEAQIESGGYGNPSEYIRALIAADWERTVARIEERLTANLKTAPIRFTAEDLAATDFVAVCRQKLQASR